MKKLSFRQRSRRRRRRRRRRRKGLELSQKEGREEIARRVFGWGKREEREDRRDEQGKKEEKEVAPEEYGERGVEHSEGGAQKWRQMKPTIDLLPFLALSM